MITVYSWLDQYQAMGFNTNPSWFGLVAVTASCRTVSINPENRTVSINPENRTVSINSENRTVNIAC